MSEITRRDALALGVSAAALAATGAKVRIDAHMVARRHNGAGRAKIEAARAAGNLRARMGAEV